LASADLSRSRPPAHPTSAVSQYEFCCRLDPSSSHNRGHDEAEKTHSGKVSLLKGIANKGFANLHPQAVLIGGGTQPARFANRKITQAHHNQWHHSPLTKEESQRGLTRFHRWHMDISLYKVSGPDHRKAFPFFRERRALTAAVATTQAQPPLCTALLCLSIPQMDKPMTVVYGDDSGDTLECAPGSTCFIAGSNMYALLSDDDKALVDNSTVEYPPHPYTCKPLHCFLPPRLVTSSSSPASDTCMIRSQGRALAGATRGALGWRPRGARFRSRTSRLGRRRT